MAGRFPGTPKTGGRQKGTKNKNKVAVQEQLDALGCNPIEGMAQIAMDEKQAPELRAKMYAELASYVHPRRKAVEHSGPGGGPIPYSDVSPRSILDTRMARIRERSATG